MPLEEIGDPFHDSDDPDWDPCRRRPATYVRRTEKSEVWQPKIGDEGIEDENDLNMVLQARKEHKARASNYEKQEQQFIKNKLGEGVALADIDMSEFLLGPKIELDDDNDDEKTDQQQETKEASSELTKETKKEKAQTLTPTRKRNKKRRVSQTIDSTYHYEADIEDEAPAKKRRKIRKGDDDDDDGPAWKAQTRSAAKRARDTGTLI